MDDCGRQESDGNQPDLVIPHVDQIKTGRGVVNDDAQGDRHQEKDLGLRQVGPFEVDEYTCKNVEKPRGKEVAYTVSGQAPGIG